MRRPGIAFLVFFAAAALGAGAGRAIVTTYLPVLLDRIKEAPGLIGAVMLVNVLAGFAVPLAVGIWSDRRATAGRARRAPLVLGGALLAAGGLGAIALGTGSSYVVLALAAAVAYTGLNALTTSHRAMIAESFEDGRRPALTSGQELAQLAGGLLGLAAGALLVEDAAPLLFAALALALPAIALPTFLATRGFVQPAPARRERTGAFGDLAGVLRTPGARHVLVAQVLWVFAYAPLPAFFILYAEHTLDLSVGAASILPAGFGVLTGLAVLAAGRASADRVFGLLVAGVVLEGVGLGGAALGGSLAATALPFALAAVGLGLVTTLGFVYFARFVPEGKAGGYSGAFFATRAVAGAAALPLAGLLVELTGSYRSVLVAGLAALPALVPLLLAERRRTAAASAPLAAPRSVTAVIPVHASYEFAAVAGDALRHVDEVVLVNDGGPAGLSEAVCSFAAEEPRVQVLQLAENAGKGSAVAFAAEQVLARPDAPEAILVLDSDGQHPPDLIPRFIEASRSSAVVIGDRSGDRRGMPLDRRLANTVASVAVSLAARRRVRDSQNGMRLYRAEALRRVPLPTGRYEAETEHLRRLLRAGERVAWVAMPTVYRGEPSSFRPLADTLRVAGAVVAPGSGGSGAGRLRAVRGVLDEWWLRLLAGIAAVLAIAAALPLLDGADAALFTSLNGLGDGPEWIYATFDPHSRNYALIVAATAAVLAVGATRGHGRAGLVLGGAVAVTASAFLSDLFLEVFQLLADRPRPEEALGDGVLLSHDRTWAHIPSYPSGHLIVTTAMAVTAAAAAPVLRPLLWVYVAAVGVTRVVFGAHFPLDVIVGIAFGYEAGLFSVALARATGLLPAGAAERLAAPALRPRRSPVAP